MSFTLPCLVEFLYFGDSEHTVHYAEITLITTGHHDTLISVNSQMQKAMAMYSCNISISDIYVTRHEKTGLMCT